MVTRRFTAANLNELANDMKPFTIGFEKMFESLNTIPDTSNNYPPYNIVEAGEGLYTIEMACAGFTDDEFNIHVVPDVNKLVVQGVQDRGTDKRSYLYKGIGARNFTRTFALTDDVKVTGADFRDGILYISLEHVVPEEKRPVEIKVGNKKSEPEFIQD